MGRFEKEFYAPGLYVLLFQRNYGDMISTQVKYFRYQGDVNEIESAAGYAVRVGMVKNNELITAYPASLHSNKIVAIMEKQSESMM
ncbi:MAG: hypothetical protein MN733_13560 [Nitrososphaera sp.]|nr:hypothetical protein [Nitrososphaera sp.]